MIERLTEEQKEEYLCILKYVMETYSTHDYKPRDWFDISSGWFIENGHKIEDEETIGVVFDEYMKERN
mgnify:FL=1